MDEKRKTDLDALFAKVDFQQLSRKEAEKRREDVFIKLRETVIRPAMEDFAAYLRERGRVLKIAEIPDFSKGGDTRLAGIEAGIFGAKLSMIADHHRDTVNVREVGFGCVEDEQSQVDIERITPDWVHDRLAALLKRCLER